MKQFKLTKLYLINSISFAGINSYRGMTDNSTHRPATVKNTKLIKTGLLSHQQQPQQAGFQQKPSLLKQPLSSLNTNYVLNSQNNNSNNNNNYYYDQKHVQQKKHDLNNFTDDALKNDVQIVLNNIQNALLNQHKNQQQHQHHQQQEYYQDQFQYLNIFGSPSPPAVKSLNHKVAINQLKNKNRKMSASPADCDNTNNNNMGPTSILGCSFASDFTQDNSDYQWFIDYG